MAHRINDRKYKMWLHQPCQTIVVGIAVLLAVSLSKSACWAQFYSGGRGVVDSMGAGGYGGEYGGRMQQPLVDPNDPLVQKQMAMSQALAVAISEYRTAQGDEAKAAAPKKLVEALTKYFDADMKVREAGLQKVEAQVKTLRSQFDKRASKKQEVIELQMKLLENEADGLGFFGGSPASPGMMPGMMGAPMMPGGTMGGARTSDGFSFRGNPPPSPRPAATPPVAPTLGTSTDRAPTIAPTESEQDDPNTPRGRQ